tara:strand:- start:11263 stop:11415 length:153 start_codon:yes stop_codon:yes gene_type:complete
VKRFRIEIDIEADDEATVETVRADWPRKVAGREWKAIRNVITQTAPETRI